jgi:hypothetical protein
MIRVIGSEVTKALLKSSPIAVLSCFSALASPNCSTAKPEWAACAALVAASVASTRSWASVSVPAISNRSRAECRSRAICPRFPGA